ncbi:MAG: hypothetical protein KTR16_12995 [Acidiferrobacterales bacterium]|nr:hypothetical protein [Acidiferrobacterales bacterium]
MADLVAIKNIQSSGLFSPYAEQIVTTRGVVTGVHRLGFFIQTPDVAWDQECSDALFVYSNETTSREGAYVEVTGEVHDYLKHDSDKPVTQLHLEQLKIVKLHGPAITPIDLTAQIIPNNNEDLAILLNSLECMLMRIPAKQTFIAASNAHGDYVVDGIDSSNPEETDYSLLRNDQGGIIADHHNHLRWFPGFRVTQYHRAPRLNVGSILLNDVIGPLHYRVGAYQLSVRQDIKFEPSFISLNKSSLVPSDNALTIMTLNCFNLDPHIESPDRVLNPQQDVDDDWGEGRFHTLAQAIVLQANLPDIVALQEIQDNDGAEITEVVDASKTYSLLVKTVEQLSGVTYLWTDVNPELGADGGQPGGNIRNGYLYNPERVSLLEPSKVFGAKEACYDGSRKPLLAYFRELKSGQTLACINLHLASKRHQASIFEPENPGFDAKLEVRVAQAKRVYKETLRLQKEGIDYYVTGDFNDTEDSKTLRTLIGSENVNLVDKLPVRERYDYNHRGKLQVLMHGIVNHKRADTAEYEIIHGNELIGVKAGEVTDKPSDHAYVIAKLYFED